MFEGGGGGRVGKVRKQTQVKIFGGIMNISGGIDNDNNSDNDTCT